MSDLSVGDVDQPYLDVTPAGVDTTGTLTVHRPDGTSSGVPVTPGPLGADPDTGEPTRRLTADPVVFDQPRRWVLSWQVMGTGVGAEDIEIWVVPSPAAGGPEWTPSRTRVATYVPHRTLARSLTSVVNSQDIYQFTFDHTTTPSGVAVDALIVDAVAWVAARVSPMRDSMHDLARAVAALLAAAWVERSWPNDAASLQRANDMERRADAMLGDLADANNAAGGTSDYGIEIVAPTWSFPTADPRYDDPRYW
ncbi:hypothetical protein AMIS_20810 [Actinoplanes missouriensis 431]|uniref:Uncharacterized protein n=1 Tax=Actinoplanes missouriensis (strain ATCC 14538 / DSM 43046 / CBS 188.64 / JCM 3121 / NBRC 102363 / NCIMB 12654 / NRRL B-3342 / UNCC 431) TaxID=512565 RepID=I0H2R4_ACTM4|nr:hypothetical protein [Actinoplanes missouriensis]BAL87301.1 hypothetical protein AMIS_20810 [Actinoplanes missouriensis 431]